MAQTFIETIKVKDGVFYNLPLHRNRLQRTAMHFFQTSPNLDVTLNDIPLPLREGLVKCRVIYSNIIHSVDFEFYHFRDIQQLAIVRLDDIDYRYKSTNREALNQALSQKGNCDDVIIVKDGFVTDTSFFNLVFQNPYGLFTPSTPLLYGIKREKLLEENKIQSLPIPLSAIDRYDKIFLINAMIDLEDEICVDTSEIKIM